MVIYVHHVLLGGSAVLQENNDMMLISRVNQQITGQ